MLSERLRDDWSLLEAYRWHVTHDGNGTGTDCHNKVINIDELMKAVFAPVVVHAIVHEVGHAMYGNHRFDTSSRESFIQSLLDSEGAAVMYSLDVRREILANGGPDIAEGVFNPNELRNFKRIYKAYLKAGTLEAYQAAIREIGKIYALGHPSGEDPGTNYYDVYGRWYDEHVVKDRPDGVADEVARLRESEAIGLAEAVETEQERAPPADDRQAAGVVINPDEPQPVDDSDQQHPTLRGETPNNPVRTAGRNELTAGPLAWLLFGRNVVADASDLRSLAGQMTAVLHYVGAVGDGDTLSAALAANVGVDLDAELLERLHTVEPDPGRLRDLLLAQGYSALDAQRAGLRLQEILRNGRITCVAELASAPLKSNCVADVLHEFDEQLRRWRGRNPAASAQVKVTPPTVEGVDAVDVEVVADAIAGPRDTLATFKSYDDGAQVERSFLAFARGLNQRPRRGEQVMAIVANGPAGGNGHGHTVLWRTRPVGRRLAIEQWDPLHPNDGWVLLPSEALREAPGEPRRRWQAAFFLADGTPVLSPTVGVDGDPDARYATADPDNRPRPMILAAETDSPGGGGEIVDLVLRAGAGEDAAEARLREIYGPRVHQAVLRDTGSPRTANGLTGTIFAQAFSAVRAEAQRPSGNPERDFETRLEDAASSIIGRWRAEVHSSVVEAARSARGVRHPDFADYLERVSPRDVVDALIQLPTQADVARRLFDPHHQWATDDDERQAARIVEMLADLTRRDPTLGGRTLAAAAAMSLVTVGEVRDRIHAAATARRSAEQAGMAVVALDLLRVGLEASGLTDAEVTDALAQAYPSSAGRVSPELLEDIATLPDRLQDFLALSGLGLNDDDVTRIMGVSSGNVGLLRTVATDRLDALRQTHQAWPDPRGLEAPAWFRAIRAHLDLDQAQFAERMGVAVGAVIQIESGEDPVSLEWGRRLYAAGVPAHWVILALQCYANEEFQRIVTLTEYRDHPDPASRQVDFRYAEVAGDVVNDSSNTARVDRWVKDLSGIYGEYPYPIVFHRHEVEVGDGTGVTLVGSILDGDTEIGMIGLVFYFDDQGELVADLAEFEIYEEYAHLRGQGLYRALLAELEPYFFGRSGGHRIELWSGDKDESYAAARMGFTWNLDRGKLQKSLRSIRDSIEELLADEMVSREATDLLLRYLARLEPGHPELPTLIELTKLGGDNELIKLRADNEGDLGHRVLRNTNLYLVKPAPGGGDVDDPAASPPAADDGGGGVRHDGGGAVGDAEASDAEESSGDPAPGGDSVAGGPQGEDHPTTEEGPITGAPAGLADSAAAGPADNRAVLLVYDPLTGRVTRLSRGSGSARLTTVQATETGEHGSLPANALVLPRRQTPPSGRARIQSPEELALLAWWHTRTPDAMSLTRYLELNGLSEDQAWRWLAGEGVDAAETEDALGQSGPDVPDPVAFVPAEPVSAEALVAAGRAWLGAVRDWFALDDTGMDKFLGVASGSWAAALTGQEGDAERRLRALRALLRRVNRDPLAYPAVAQLFPTLGLMTADGKPAFPEGYPEFQDYLCHLAGLPEGYPGFNDYLGQVAAGKKAVVLAAQLDREITVERVASDLAGIYIPDLDLVRAYLDLLAPGEVTWVEVAEWFAQWRLPIVFPSPHSTVSAKEYVDYLLQRNGLGVPALERELGLPRGALAGIGGDALAALRLYDALVTEGCPWHWNDFAEAWGFSYRMDPDGETWPNPSLYLDARDWWTATQLYLRTDHNAGRSRSVKYDAAEASIMSIMQPPDLRDLLGTEELYDWTRPYVLDDWTRPYFLDDWTRPYVQVATVRAVEEAAQKTPDGKYYISATDENVLIPVSKQYDEAILNLPKTPNGDYYLGADGLRYPVDPNYHLGHIAGVEWWRIRDMAKFNRWPRARLVEYCQMPWIYQIEDAPGNLSHKFELSNRKR